MHDTPQLVLLAAILALVVHISWFVHRATRQLKGEIAAAAVIRATLDAEFPDRRPPTDPPTVQGRRPHLQVVRNRRTVVDVLRRLVSVRQVVAVGLVVAMTVVGAVLTAEPISRHTPVRTPAPGAAYADMETGTPAPPQEEPAAPALWKDTPAPEKVERATPTAEPSPTLTPSPTVESTVRPKRTDPPKPRPTRKPTVPPQPKRTVEPLPVPTIRITTGCVQAIDVRVCVTR